MTDADTLDLQDDADMHPVDAPWEELRVRDRMAAVRSALATIRRKEESNDRC